LELRVVGLSQPRETPIHFAVHKLSDSHGNPIIHSTQDGTYRFITTPRLEMSPTSKTCRMYGETFQIAIDVSGVTDVTDFEFEIHYNTTLMDCVGVTWNAWGSGNANIDEANGIITGTTSGTTISGTQTLVTLQFTATYHRIWKDEGKVLGWKNDQAGLIYIQSASLSYPSGPDLVYTRGGSQNQISVGPDVLYTFSPIQGDVDNNGIVSVFDLRTVAAFYDLANPTYDLNGDGIISLFDLVLISVNYGFTYP
jgi:hypothetical protein